MRKLLSNNELKKILETTNERDLFLVGHMYIENTIDRILHIFSIVFPERVPALERKGAGDPG